MRKLSLYWKTWIFTVCTILITSALFFIALSYSMSWLVESVQVRKFDQSIINIENDLQEFGINNDILDKYLLQGFSIAVMEGDTMLFPDHDGIIFNIDANEANKTPLNEISEVMIDSEEFLNVDVFVTGSVLSIDKPIILDGKPLLLSVIYPLSFNSSDVQAIFTTILPYFVFLGVIIATFSAFIYARFFSGKITCLNTIISSMSSQSYPNKSTIPTKGDEIQSLENNLNLMYQKLTHTMMSLNEEVSRVNRLEEDRRLFMRGAVHELKTPIMTMSTYILMNMDVYAEDPVQLDFLNHYHGKLQGMSLLVNEILEVSKLESIRTPGKSQLDEAIKASLDIFEYMIEDKKLSIHYIAKPDVYLEIPKRNLMKVISNLCGNAIKYAHEDTQINIDVTQSTMSISNTIQTKSTIDLDKIMEPFVSFENAEESFKGHGLGLYIVASILDHYQYRYDVAISDNQFTFTILFKKEPSAITV